MIDADLPAAEAALSAVSDVVDAGCAALRASGPIDENQLLAYALAHAASARHAATSLVARSEPDARSALAACVFVADVATELNAAVWGNEATWGVSSDPLAAHRSFVARFSSAAALSQLAIAPPLPTLDDEFGLVRDTFRRFATDRVAPHAESVHRNDLDLPETLIADLAELGGFGLSVPERYGGFATAGSNEYLAMVVATEELSRASLGIGGSLLTRPEILTRALVKGGTEDQKLHWLPRIAGGEAVVAVAVTEPDFGSDVASLRVSATRRDDGWLINGVKTWCTLAGRADTVMLLARTDLDADGHRGLSSFIVEKPVDSGHAFSHTQPTGGHMEGRAISTIGYRGMHSFEVAFDDWFVPHDHLIGGDDGVGRGFYLQMEGFENGRLQTAARAVGLMQAAYDEASSYAEDRVVFGRPIARYQLTQAKLGRMVAMISACRAASYAVAAQMADGAGRAEASMVKAYSCKAAEWVTREALQIHGGMGYAEEFAVSRYFVDARVLSIFEGADETLCLKVIARHLTA